MYKDKDKQREADRERQRRYRANRGLKAYPKGVTGSGCDKQGVTDRYIGAVPGAPPILEPNLKRGKDIKCFADLPPDVQLMLKKVNYDELYHKPGDADYNGICTPEWRVERGR